MGMLEINEIAERVAGEADPDANIIFGAAVNEEMTGKVSVTIIATDFGGASGMPNNILGAPEVSKPVFEGAPVQVEGMDGYEVDFADLMQEKADKDPQDKSSFDIPEFLR